MALKNALEKGKFFVATPYDLIIFEAYIHEIPLLPHIPTSRIIVFYGELKNINYAIATLQNEKLNLEDNAKKHWIDYIYTKSYKCIGNGKVLLTYLENEFNIDTQPFKGHKKILDAKHTMIIEKDPSLKEKLTIQE